MNKKELKEILAAHADQLITDQSEDEAEFQVGPEFAPLLTVAEQVKTTLKPMTPSEEFEAELKRRLLATAHLRQAEGYTPPNPGHDLLILAAVLSFVLSLGAILLTLKIRNSPVR